MSTQFVNPDVSPNANTEVTSPEDTTPAVIDGLALRIAQFAASLQVEDFANLSFREEKAQYIGTTSVHGKGAGRPPIDFVAVDAYVDMKIALERGTPAEAIAPYYQLRRLLNY